MEVKCILRIPFYLLHDVAYVRDICSLRLLSFCKYSRPHVELKILKKIICNTSVTYSSTFV